MWTNYCTFIGSGAVSAFQRTLFYVDTAFPREDIDERRISLMGKPGRQCYAEVSSATTMCYARRHQSPLKDPVSSLKKSEGFGRPHLGEKSTCKGKTKIVLFGVAHATCPRCPRVLSSWHASRIQSRHMVNATYGKSRSTITPEHMYRKIFIT